MDFVVDFETMGTEDSSVILSVGVVAMPESNPDVNTLLQQHSIGLKLNRNEQIAHGRTIDKNTVKWWSMQGAAAKNVLSNSGLVPCAEAYDAIVGFMVRNGYNTRDSLIWSRGLIDQRWWQSFCKSFGKNDVLPFWTWRDTSTALHIFTGKTDGGISFDDYSMLTRHDAKSDAVLDAIRLQSCACGTAPQVDEVMF